MISFFMLVILLSFIFLIALKTAAVGLKMALFFIGLFFFLPCILIAYVIFL